MAKSGGGDKHQQASVIGMVLARVFLGAFFLFDGINRLSDSAAFVTGLQRATTVNGSFVHWSAWQPFTSFLKHTVHPHADLFAWLFMLLGVLAGGLLLIGFLTRLGAILAIPINLFFLLATIHAPAPNFGFNLAFLVLEVAVLIAAAGRTLGFDALLARHTRVKLLW